MTFTNDFEIIMCMMHQQYTYFVKMIISISDGKVYRVNKMVKILYLEMNTFHGS